MIENEIQMNSLREKTRKFAFDVVLFCHSLKTCKASSACTNQLITSATSTGAKYHAAYRAKSKSEFLNIISVISEELYESSYRLEIIIESNLHSQIQKLQQLINVSNELIKTLNKVKTSNQLNFKEKNENHRNK